MDSHSCSDKEDANKLSATEEVSTISIHVVGDEPANPHVGEFVDVPGHGDTVASIAGNIGGKWQGRG